MSFIQNAEEVARNAMGEVDPTLQAKYASVICFLAAFPEAARANRGASAPAIGSKQYIEQNANVFASARKYRALTGDLDKGPPLMRN